jgi:hypothetical protein
LCESRNIEVPVLNSVSTPIHIQSTESSFLQTGMYDTTNDVLEIRTEQHFEEIRYLNVQAVEYTILSNNSITDTKISGSVQVSSDPDKQYKKLFEFNDIELDHQVGTTHITELDSSGVQEIFNALANIVAQLDSGRTNELYYRIKGNAATNSKDELDTDFTMEIITHLAIVGVVDVGSIL